MNRPPRYESAGQGRARVSISSDAPGDLDAALAVAVAAGGEIVPPLGRDLDHRLDGLLSSVARLEHRGRLHAVVSVPTAGRLAAPRVLLYGLGAPADLDGHRLRNVHLQLVREARLLGFSRVALTALSTDEGDLAAQVEGAVMGCWERRSFQSGRRDRQPLEDLLLCGFDGRAAEVERAVEAAEATNFARELMNLPANELSPEALAEVAAGAARRTRMSVEVLGPQEIAAGGYRLLEAVAAGSERQPRLIRMEHRPTGVDSGPVLALVGKGVTFDSGGLSLKPAESMEQMKHDMGGAAAVIAAMEVIARRNVPMRVLGVVAATDNMPSGHAVRPGDIVTSKIGKTVEIVNTDAEGRLILADALTHAIEHGATHLVDAATLTGAAKQAIGHVATAAVSNDEALWATAAAAAAETGDRAWRLPLHPDHRVLLRSLVADIRNSGYREAGTIMGGMFLQEFVQDRPWIHLDIASSSWNSNVQLTTIPRGPLGAGTRLMIRIAELMAAGGR